MIGGNNMFDENTKENLKYYVYLLIDPENDEPFYVGKGKNNRVFDHIKQEIEEENEILKYQEIKRIGAENVKHIIVRHGLDESAAFAIEASLIDTFRYIPSFNNNFIMGNIQGGYKSIEKGLMTTDEIIRKYNAKPLTELPSNYIIININENYERGACEDRIYKATKEIWCIGKRRKLEEIHFVLSEYRGLIVEVFQVKEWYEKERGYHPNAQKYGQTRIGYGFEGVVAEEDLRKQYVNKSVNKPRGYSYPIIYPGKFSDWGSSQ